MPTLRVRPGSRGDSQYAQKKASRALREEGRARIRLSVSLSWRPAIPVRRSVCLSCANVDIKIDNEWTPVRPGGSQPTERVHVLSLRSSPLGDSAVPGTMECGEQIGWRALGRKDGECQQPSESVTSGQRATASAERHELELCEVQDDHLALSLGHQTILPRMIRAPSTLSAALVVSARWANSWHCWPIGQSMART